MSYKLHKTTPIKYTKGNGDVSSRSIIPTYVPVDNIKAVDVTELSTEDATKMETLVHEYYTDYVAGRMACMFSFEDWLSAQGVSDDISTKVKWRTFSVDKIQTP